MDAIVSQLLLALVFSSSNCLIWASKSEGGPDVVRVDGGVRCGSISRDWDVVLEVLFKVMVTLGFDIWILPRTLESWKAAELGGPTVKGTGIEEGYGSFIFAAIELLHLQVDE